MDRPVQLEIDFSKRGAQLNALGAAVLRPQQGVSAQMLKAALRAIDDFGRGSECWPSISSLHHNANMSRRQMIRSLAALERAGLLIRERGDGEGRSRKRNYYRIVWSELALLGRARPTTAHRAAAPINSSNDKTSSSVGGEPSPLPPPLARAPATMTRALRPRLNDHSLPMDRDRGSNGDGPPAPIGAMPAPIGAMPAPIGATVARMSANVSPKALRSVFETQKKPPPPSSKENALLRDTTWAAAADVLFRIGLADVDRAISEARRNGVHPSSIVELARVFEQEENAGRWQLGGLHWRVRNFRPGQSPADLSLWPKPSPEFLATEKSRRLEASRVAAVREAAQQDQLAAERVDEESRLEREHGARLDARTDQELARLAERLPPSTLNFCRAKLAKRPIEGTLRLELLALIDQQAAAARADGWQKGTVR
jgi:DNA-binding transcriptional ArsR family regulator